MKVPLKRCSFYSAEEVKEQQEHLMRPHEKAHRNDSGSTMAAGRDV
jgi:hypothetical protein